MATGDDENVQHELVKGGRLPPSLVEFVEVEEDHIVFYVEEDLEEYMKDTKSNFWQSTLELKEKFKLPAGTLPRQRVDRQVTLAFPYCLLIMAPTLPGRLIVINWWLNLSHDKQKEKWAFLKTKFERPRVSTVRNYEYNEVDPMYRGVADGQELRSGAAKKSRSWEIVFGGEKRTSAFAPAKSSRQVRDKAVRVQQAVVERATRQLCERTSVDKKVAGSVKGFFHPVSSMFTNVPTPKRHENGKQSGRPKKNDEHVLFASPQVTHFTRNEDSMAVMASQTAKNLTRVSGGTVQVDTPLMLAAYKRNAKMFYSEDTETKWPSEIMAASRATSGITPPLTEAETANRQALNAANLSDCSDDHSEGGDNEGI